TVLLSEVDSNTILSNAVGVSFAVNERTGGYIEYFAEFPDRGDSRHTLNGGVTWLSRINLQYDVQAGVGLNDDAADFFLGAGVAYRFR
ncbi:MAG: transporter, partial [Woeseiaceae bacterium]|nr:transporter [Woeseiaceae bacterium]